MVPVPEDLPEMEYRYLGPSGLQVSAIALGGWLTYGGHVENGMVSRLLWVNCRINMQ